MQQSINGAGRILQNFESVEVPLHLSWSIHFRFIWGVRLNILQNHQEDKLCSFLAFFVLYVGYAKIVK
jgi:hypothetical protein